MIRLITLPNVIEASLLQQKLELEGIESFTTNEYISTMLPHLYGIMGAGIQIMVSESDYEKAKGVLLVSHLNSEVLKCPNCGSTNIGYGLRGKKRFGDQFLVLFALLFGIPMGNIRNKNLCRDCQHDFE